MHVNFFNEDNSSPHLSSNSFLGERPQKPRKKYGFFRFTFDAGMTIITGGLWIIWIFVREMRRR